MNPERLLAHFETISEAPDAVARLRRFILDLAVRGKLVDQDPEDEPAEELLGKILELKIRSFGKLPKSDPHMIDRLFTNEPFAIPDSWTWVVLGQIADAITSGSRDWAKHYSDSGAIFVRMGNLAKGDYRLRLDSIQYVSPPVGGEGTRTRLEAWDVLVSITGDVGMLGLIPENFGEAYINQHTALARPCSLLKGRYLPEVLRSDFAQSQFQEPQRGIKNSFRLSDLSAIAIPLPPLAEQHRIVAKVDELMALCDQLEAARQQREQHRERLVAAALQRLSQPAEDPNTARNDARFALQVLPALTTTPAQVKQLRQTILNLAVRGKLVEQDPEDEPPLRSGIFQQHQVQSPKRAKRGRASSIASLDIERYQQALPVSWRSFRLADLVAQDRPISYGVLVPGDDVPNGVPFVRAQDLALDRHPSKPGKSISPDVEKAYSRTRLLGGEILICVVGSIGKLGVVPAEWAGANIARAVARIAPISDSIKHYLLLVLRSSLAQSFFLKATRTLAQPTLNIGLLEEIPIPLPPLAEQHRIVAKVDELMALCDQLEQQLSQADQQRRRLLEAVLAEALREPVQVMEGVTA